MRTTTIVMTASRSAPGGPSGHGSDAPGTSANLLATCAMTVVGTTPTQAASSAARADGPTPVPPPPRPPWRSARGERRGSSRGSPTTLTEPCSTTTSGAVMACAATGIARAGPKGARRVGKAGPDRLTPRSGEEEEAERRQRRQREAERPGEPRVEDEHDDDRGAEHRRSSRPPRPAEPDEPDRAHGCRPDDARLGPRQHDEPGEREQRQHRPQPAWDAEDDAEPEHHAGDHRDVAAAHRREVRHAGGAHRRGEVVRGAAGVADDQSREQAPGVGGCVVHGGCGARPAGARRRTPRAPGPPGGPAAHRPRAPRRGRPPRSAGASRPWTSTVDRHAGSTRDSSPMSTTGARVPRRTPRESTTTAVASRRTLRCSPRPVSTTGSPVTTTTAGTEARSAASARTPPRSRSSECPAAATWRRTTRTARRMTGHRHRASRRHRISHRLECTRAGTRPSTVASPAITRCPRTPMPRPAAATTQASTAGAKQPQVVRPAHLAVAPAESLIGRDAPGLGVTE